MSYGKDAAMLVVGGPLHGNLHGPDDTTPYGYVPTDIRIKSDLERVLLWHELFGSSEAERVHRAAVRVAAEKGEIK